VPHDATARCWPQLSTAIIAPQFFPRRAQSDASDSGAQPQLLGTSAPQVSGFEQLPQEATALVVPQRSCRTIGHTSR
jgi:hypothetical protein